jgi:hypothetical protein
MRSLFVAVVVLGLAVALLSRSVLAEPPPAMEPRDVTKILAALEAKPGLKAELASVRFYAEVLGQRSLQAPVGSSLETLGPWSDNGALLGAEGLIAGRQCSALTAEQLTTASAILKESGDAMPVTLTAYTLAQQGKKSEAASLFSKFIDDQLPGGPCPSEHPMYSHRRVGRISFALQCLKVLAPSRDVAAQEKRLQRSQQCARNNHAVG